MATTGIAMQGLSAAIVYTAIDKIGKMITDAEGRMQSKIGPAITQIIDGIPGEPEVAKAKHSNSLSAVLTALGPASGAASAPLWANCPRSSSRPWARSSRAIAAWSTTCSRVCWTQAPTRMRGSSRP